MAEILEEIYRTFPDLEPDNDGQAYQRALVDWSLNRDKNSKSQKLSDIKSDTAAIREDATQIKVDTRRIDIAALSIQQQLAELRALVIPRLERLVTLEAAMNSGCDCAPNYDEEGMEL